MIAFDGIGRLSDLVHHLAMLSSALLRSGSYALCQTLHCVSSLLHLEWRFAPVNWGLRRMDKRREIDFLGIGAHGAGSAWLWNWMSRHPEIGFVRPGAGDGRHEKEVHYWNRHPDKAIDWYLDHFDWAKQIVGEITPAYARLPQDVVKGVHKIFPAIHVLYVVRDPLYRTWSDVKRRARKLRFNRDRLRLKWIIEQASRPKVAIRNDYVKTAENWRSAFGNEQMHVFPYTLISDRPKQFLCRICEILDLDPGFYDDMDDLAFVPQTHCNSEADCPRDYVEWFQQQSVMPWQEQLRHLENMGVLETMGEPIAEGDPY
jgi:hypothetical protein